jgi:hypothetical protein
MTGSPSDKGTDFARHLIKGLRGYFGDGVRDFVVSDVQVDPGGALALSMRFTIYDYFPLIFNFDRGAFGFAIDFGHTGVSIHTSSERSAPIEDLAAVAAELDDAVRLRIPDKFLDAHPARPA